MFVKQNIEKAISVLKQRFGNSLSTSKSILEQHTHTTSIIKSELPDAVIFPENKNDILEIVNVCSKEALHDNDSLHPRIPTSVRIP